MNNKHISLLFLACFIHSVIQAQITISVKGLNDNKVFLTQMKYGKNFILDTLEVENSIITISQDSLPENLLYNVTFPSLEYRKLDFINTGQPIKISTHSNDLLMSTIVQSDDCNVAIYKDLQLNIPLLDQLLELEENGSKLDSIIQLKQSLIKHIKANRKDVLFKYKHTQWGKLMLLDNNSELPYFNEEKYKSLFEKYNHYEGHPADFLKNIYIDTEILASSSLYERRIRAFIEDPINYNSDSVIFYMDSLFAIVNKSRMVFEHTVYLYYNRFNTLAYHDLERAMIHFWNKYMKDDEVDPIDALSKWKFGKLITIRENTVIGEKFLDFEARDESFNKIKLQDIKGEKRILVFWNPSWQAHWIHIAYWRDDFNESGMYNQGFRLIFIGVKNDEYKWSRAIDKIQINDKPNYINRLNDPIFEKFFDSDLKIEYPLSYLIDENGIVIDKFKRDILEYSNYTD